MAIELRRVITGHDASGRAVVKIDEISKNVISNRPGASACVVWTTDSIPADNSGESDAGLKKTGTTLPGGTVFRVVEFSPGVSPRVHRTDSIDYAVVISGEIDMELEKGKEVHQGGRRPGAARHGAQLDQPRQRALRHRLLPHRRQACGRGRKDPRRLRLKYFRNRLQVASLRAGVRLRPTRGEE